MKTLLIDDEKNALEVLEIQLQTHFAESIAIIGSYYDSRKGIEAIQSLRPQLVFLDIEMPFKNGFEVIEATKDIDYKIIFTTAYNQFAVKAFKVSAVDYLLKPIDKDELITAVNKALSQPNSFMENQIATLLNHFKPKLENRIGLNIGDTLQFFDASDFIRFESDSNYTHIFLSNGKKITSSKTLKEVEDKLNGSPFFRIHHSHLINLNYLSKHIKGNAGYVVMSDGSQVSISRSKKEEFLALFRSL